MSQVWSLKKYFIILTDFYFSARILKELMSNQFVAAQVYCSFYLEKKKLFSLRKLD